MWAECEKIAQRVSRELPRVYNAKAGRVLCEIVEIDLSNSHDALRPCPV